MRTEHEPHRAREWAESFGSDAERYDRARPRYPDALVEPDRRRQPRPRRPRCRLRHRHRRPAVPGGRLPGARGRCRRADGRLGAASGARGRGGDVRGLGSRGPSFDAVIAGQTWHWVDPVAGAAKAAQALRPGGRLAVFWNVFQPPPELATASPRSTAGLLPDLPAMHRGHARPGRVLGAVRQGGRRDAAGGRVRRTGAVAVRLGAALHPRRVAGSGADRSAAPASSRRHACRSCWRASAPPSTRSGGSFTMRYATVAATAARI